MTEKSFAKAMEYENTSVDSIKTEEESDRMSDTSSQSDCISGYSKKIIKKRKKYSKIDDEIRMKLLEDVEKNGDTLKAAATRYGVNYSSAKSIFHTYRKEGRILKKPARERYRRKPLLPPAPVSNTSTEASSPGLPISNPTPQLDINGLVGANQVLSQFQQIQTLTVLLKAAQESSIIQQLQNIQSLLQKTIATHETKNTNDNLSQIVIPKAVHAVRDNLGFKEKVSTFQPNEHSIFSKVHSGKGFRTVF
jgi:hypothetical protein